MLSIAYKDETGKMSDEQQKIVFDLLNLTAKKLNLEGEIELSYTVVDDPTIQKINWEYRHIDRPTDVISFAINDPSEGEERILDWPEDLPLELGDLIVSYDTGQAHAKEYGHSFERELGYLTVHGFLHLNGYDHMTKEDEKVMITLQENILDEYGLKRN